MKNTTPRSSSSSVRALALLAVFGGFFCPRATLAADPWAPSSTHPPFRTAVVVEGATGANADDVETAVRDVVSGTDVVDAGAVRAARSFAGMRGELDDSKAERLRQELAVERLLVVEVREEGSKRFLVARAIDARGISRKYGEARTGQLGGSVRELVDALLATPSSEAAQPLKKRPAPLAAGPGPYVNVDVLLAQKQLESDDWRPVSDQLELGVVGTFGGEAWPVQAAADFYRSVGSDRVQGFDQTGSPVSVDVEGTTTEIAFGARKIFAADALRPHVGAGIAMVSASIHARTNTGYSGGDSDSALGPWVAVGADIRAGKNLNIGMLLRWSSANVELNGVSGDAGGLHFGLTIGAGFGSAAGQR